MEQNLDRKLDDRLGVMEQSLDRKLDDRLGVMEQNLDRKLDERFGVMEQRLDQKFGYRFGVVMEHFDHKFDILIEAFQVVTSIMARDSDLQEVKADVSLIKKVVTSTNKDMHRLGNRVENIETHLAIA